MFHDTRSFLRENVVQPEELYKFDAQYEADSRFNVVVSSSVPENCLLTLTNRVPKFEVQDRQLLRGCGVGGLQMRGRMQESLILREGFYIQLACTDKEIERLVPSEGTAYTKIRTSSGHRKRLDELSVATTDAEDESEAAASTVEAVGVESTEDNPSFDGISTIPELFKSASRIVERKTRYMSYSDYDGPLDQDFCKVNKYSDFPWQEFVGRYQDRNFPSEPAPGDKLKISSLQSCSSISGCTIDMSSNAGVLDRTSAKTARYSPSKTAKGGSAPSLMDSLTDDQASPKIWVAGGKHKIGLNSSQSDTAPLKPGQQGFLECQTTTRFRRFVRCYSGFIEEKFSISHELDGDNLATCLISLVLVP